jgi:hypothetical protein
VFVTRVTKAGGLDFVSPAEAQRDQTVSHVEHDRRMAKASSFDSAQPAAC